MRESEVMQVFNGYKNQLVKKLGTKITDNEQLTKVAYAVLGNRFKGVYAQDTLPMNKNGMFIMNTDISSKPGVHWVAIYSTKTKLYVWDSFGRKTKNLLKLLTRNARAVNKTIVDADYDQDQKITSMVCGPLSIAWLLTVKQLGITNALKV